VLTSVGLREDAKSANFAHRTKLRVVSVFVGGSPLLRFSFFCVLCFGICLLCFAVSPQIWGLRQYQGQKSFLAVGVDNVFARLHYI
jgi:hypothetical protein